MFDLPEDFRDLSASIYEANRKWWVDLHTGKPKDRDLGEVLMLTISEVSEAMEGERKSLMDDKLPHRKMAEVEMADVVIRLIDLAENKDLNLIGTEWLNNPFEMDDNVGSQLLYICALICKMHGEFMDYDNGVDEIELNRRACAILNAVLWYCHKKGYDLWGAVREKHEYNQHREDHKTENRLKEGGKKW